ncbi:class I SAM-dependent methyltransferase (plasmid) [Pedobacter sp. BS3]|uniref:class I SAM-dependent methyltransferase n=1 Tax=Pedobacter sp. BS3 TaxID=2567937 RepID=UPI0011ED7DC3|nr:class I SAM-dependent methyltransferase [Pedobacter sp. BS3]TZF85826.1 class I SAM-dependent methyltransferase [Pedobacter sp. BS3]
MSNLLTDRQFWTKYWESKTDLVYKVPFNYPFHEQLTSIVKHNAIQTAIELGGFPGYYAIFLKKYLQVNASLLDYFVHHGILNKLLEQNGLHREDIQVIEADLFTYKSHSQYDLVLSCGLIEHFTDTKDIISRHLSFLKPGGTLFITLPNFRGVNGWVQKTFDPENYAKHNIDCMDINLLKRTAAELGLHHVNVRYYGGYSIWLENKEKKSALTRLFIKSLWFAGKIPAKLLGFESRLLSPYIVLEAKY